MIAPFRRVALARLLLAVALAVVSLGCPSTFKYRALQGDFVDAVQTDNQAAVDPLAEPLFRETARAAYVSIANELTEQQIDELDPKLQANAWTIRSYSLWRAGRYREAMTSARRGLEASDLRPRDRILLELIDALALDSETRDLWVEAGKQLPDFASYEPFDERFVDTNKALERARSQIDDTTPDGTKHYFAYQRWRILRNWDQVIASVDPEAAPSPDRDQARDLARQTHTDGPAAAANESRDAIPDEHPLRKLITEQGGG